MKFKDLRKITNCKTQFKIMNITSEKTAFIFNFQKNDKILSKYDEYDVLFINHSHDYLTLYVKS